MDIDKLIHLMNQIASVSCFGSLMDIDKLIPNTTNAPGGTGFGSLMDIDKLILDMLYVTGIIVLVL